MPRTLSQAARAWVLALCAIIAAAALAGCNLSAPAVAVSGAPVVTLLSPADATPYGEGVVVTLQVQVANAGPDIARVEIAVDGALVGTIADANPEGRAAFTLAYGWPAAGIGQHEIAVTAFRADGSSGAPARATITVVPNPGGAVVAAPQQVPTATATAFVDAPAAQASPPTAPSQPIATPLNPTATTPVATAEPTSSAPPVAAFSQSVNVRQGPGRQFPAIMSMAVGQTTDILAVNGAGDWLKIRVGGGEGWVLAELVTITGSLAGLPREGEAPAVDATGTANLRVGAVALNPPEPVCNQPFTLSFEVVNAGGAAASAGSVAVVDARAADGAVVAEASGAFADVPGGATARVDVPLLVSAYYNERHRLTLTIDPANAIGEASESDNAVSVEFVLAKGTCP